MALTLHTGGSARQLIDGKIRSVGRWDSEVLNDWDKILYSYCLLISADHFGIVVRLMPKRASIFFAFYSILFHSFTLFQ